ncbi:anti-phage protein KwaA [Caldifermentibacillus hisashii]|uniref:anti-phage protein KwaA n=1 Tax=Caldifermentibacillus hisashii TaxID=996558 RepID=UPI00341E14B7
MNSTLWDKIELYIVSLWLLFLLIIVVTIDFPTYTGKGTTFIGFKEIINNNIIPLISILFLFLGFIFINRFRYKLDGSNKTPFEITHLENINYEHLTFLSTYIVPLIAFDLTKIKYVIVLIILLITIGGIYIKTDIFYANPTLALIGYRIYKVNGIFRTGIKNDIIIISREKIRKGMKVSYREINEKVYYVRVVK